MTTSAAPPTPRRPALLSTTGPPGPRPGNGPRQTEFAGTLIDPARSSRAADRTRRPPRSRAITTANLPLRPQRKPLAARCPARSPRAGHLLTAPATRPVCLGNEIGNPGRLHRRRGGPAIPSRSFVRAAPSTSARGPRSAGPPLDAENLRVVGRVQPPGRCGTDLVHQVPIHCLKGLPLQ